jgi:hypothetical protein
MMELAEYSLATRVDPICLFVDGLARTVTDLRRSMIGVSRFAGHRSPAWSDDVTPCSQTTSPEANDHELASLYHAYWHSMRYRLRGGVGFGDWV